MRVTNRGLRQRAVLATLAMTLVVPSVASAAGFSIFEAGSRATAVAGAFVARADDPSAMFYNPAGIASLDDKPRAMVGMTLIVPRTSFDGANPYPGEGYTAKQKDLFFFPPNFYITYPLGKGVTLGLGSWFPFGLSTAWDDPDNFRGKYLSQRIDLREFALGLQLGVKVTDWLSIGAGPELRISDVKLQKNASVYNPYTAKFVDVGHLDITQEGFSYNGTWGAGIQLKPSKAVSLGVSYHAAVNQSYSGNGILYKNSTGYADLDAKLAASLPYNENTPVSTLVQFPAIWQFGASFNVSPCVTLDLAAVYTQWSVFSSTVIAFGNAPSGKTLPTTTLDHKWDNAWSYRAGMSWLLPSERVELAGGFLYDQTPQPDYDTSPLLPDANRTGVSVGFSWKVFKNTWVDFSNLFLFFHDRTITQGQKDNYYGTYKTYANLTVLNLRTSL